MVADVLTTMTRLAARRARRRRMATEDATVQHGLEAGDRVRTPDGPGTVWHADMRSSWVVTVEPDTHPSPGQWWVEYGIGDVERIYVWEDDHR